MESASPRDSEAVEEIGYYNPRKDPSVFDIDKDRAKYWLEKGAQPTDTVAQYLVKEGLLESLSKGSTAPGTEKTSTKEKEE
jgi:small subunit ribosomal protein S16